VAASSASVQMAAESLRAAVPDGPQHFQLGPRQIRLKRAADRLQVAAREMKIYSRVRKLRVSQKDLNGSKVGARTRRMSSTISLPRKPCTRKRITEGRLAPDTARIA
jgi:hypothetical protein